MGKGLSGSRHGGLANSRHGKGRSLGFRAKAKGVIDNVTSGLTQSVGTSKNKGDVGKSKWAALLTPPILFDNIPTR